MASLLDTTGGYVLELGLAGAEASGSLSEKDTFINTATTGGLDSAGKIDFGTIVAKDGSTDKGVVPYATVDGSQRPVGITSRIALDSATQTSNVIGYPSGKAVAVYRTGDVVCYAAEAVREGDQVCAVAVLTVATGLTTNVGGTKGGAANGSTRVAMPGHVWKTTTAAGAKGVVSVFRRDGMAVLTS